MLIKHRGREKETCSQFDQLSAVDKALVCGLYFIKKIQNPPIFHSILRPIEQCSAVQGWESGLLLIRKCPDRRWCCGLQGLPLTVQSAFLGLKPDNSTAARLCLSWPNLSEASHPLLRHRNYSKLNLNLWNKGQMTLGKKVIQTKTVPSGRKYNCGEVAAVFCAGLFCSSPAFAARIYFQQMAHHISHPVFPQI